MKNIFWLLFFICYSFGLYSQNNDSAKVAETDTNWRVRNVIWITPVAPNTKINGLAVGGTAISVYYNNLIVNGLNTEIGIGMLFLPYIFWDPNGDPIIMDSCGDFYKKPPTVINGVTASITGHCGKTKVNGVSINGVSAVHYQCNGIMAATVGCLTGEFNGLVVSGITNKACKGRGMQIALFNSCTKLKGFQIGLINKNQKRTLPFINWCFSD